jgi:hypothetical protein
MDYSPEKLEQLKGLHDNHESKNLVHAPYTRRELFTTLCQHTFSDCSQPHLESKLLTMILIFYRNFTFKKAFLYHVIPHRRCIHPQNTKSEVLTLKKQNKKKLAYLGGNNPHISRHTIINRVYFSAFAATVRNFHSYKCERMRPY